VIEVNDLLNSRIPVVAWKIQLLNKNNTYNSLYCIWTLPIQSGK